MVPVASRWLGTQRRPPTLAFLGWFGPRGLASIVFAVLVVESEGDTAAREPHPGHVFFTIALSVLAHGLTAAPLARRYSRWFATHPRDDAPRVESGEVKEVRWRFERAATGFDPCSLAGNPARRQACVGFSTSVLRSPWAAPEPALPPPAPRRTKANPTAMIAPVSGPTTYTQ